MRQTAGREETNRTDLVPQAASVTAAARCSYRMKQETQGYVVSVLTASTSITDSEIPDITPHQKRNGFNHHQAP